jgi:predicted PurR-regulated permease PerM
MSAGANDFSRPAGSGPLVWAAIIGSTCVLLVALQQVLWLVVPALLALILYYLLYPLMNRLIFAGVSRDASAGLVMVGFLIALGGGSLLLAPWLTENFADMNALVTRYLDGGFKLLDRSLRSFESAWAPLAQARLADTVADRLHNAGGHMTEYIEPVARGLMAWAPSLLLAPFLAFFFLRDGQRFQRFLADAVPNAIFERSLYLLNEVDRTLRAYFTGLIKLTVLDTLTLAAGLALINIPGAFALGLICAILAWIPYVGTIAGGLLVVLVAATDFPGDPSMAYWAIALFAVARLLDDFVYMPITIGKSLHMHPLITVLMIFVGGAVAGVSGLMLVLPLLGVVMVIGETIGKVVTDDRLMARYRHGRELRRAAASADLHSGRR